MEWSGGGDPATASGSCSFVTKWATAGAKCVHAASPCSGGYKWVTVVEVDLDIYNGRGGSMVPEPNEIDTGAYLLVNWDDDDDDYGPDMDETGTVDDEDDLARIDLHCSVTDSGTLSLVKSSSVKIWQNETKGTEQTDLSWNLANSELPPSTLWVEGTGASNTERDVELELKYIYGGSTVASDTVKATVVEIRLGNAVYRDINKPWPFPDIDRPRGHSALIYEFTGTCTPADLNDPTKFKIIEMSGPTNNKTLDTMTDLGPAYPCHGCYTDTSDITYSKRLAIIKTAKVLVGMAPIDYQWNDALLPDNWNGTVANIASLRCDGLVEVCYELNGINVWAMRRNFNGITYNFDISDQTDILSYNGILETWSAGSDNEKDNLEEHNDFDSYAPDWYGTLMPATQSGHTTPVDAFTTFSQLDLCEPVGHTGGN